MTKKSGIRSRAKAAVAQAAFGVSLLALGAHGAFAQEAQYAEAGEVSGVTVTATPNVADSPRYTAPVLDLPQTITVVEREIIDQQNLLGLRDVLSTLPGITFGAGEGGGGYGDSINLRGYSASNDITVDGVRDSAQYTRSDPFNLDQIEVTNGANSVYGGAGSIGGSINLVTRRPVDSTYAIVTGAIGTDEYARGTLDWNQELSDTAAFRLNAMVHGNDVPGRDVERNERWGVAPSISFGMGEQTEITILAIHQEDDNTPQYGVPYALNAFNDGPLPSVDPSDYFGYSNVDRQEIELNSATLIVEHEFNENARVRNLTRWQRVTQEAIVNPPQGTYCLESGINPFTGAACAPAGEYNPSGPRGNFRDTENEILINQTDFTFNFNTGAIAHTLVAGFSFSEEQYRLDTGRVLRNPLGALPDPVLPPMDITNPDHIYTGPINRIQTGFTDSEVSNQAIYLFDRMEFGEHWEVNGGVRLEHNEGHANVNTIAVPYPAPPAQPVVTIGPDADNEDTLLSYRLGVIYSPIEDLNLYVAYGNSRAPSQSTVNGACTAVSTTGTANCNLDPEEAEGWEIGAKWLTNGGRLQLTAALFRNERTNFRVASGDPLVPEQQLDGSARVTGVALGVAGLITDNWSIYANYTFLDSEILQNISDIAIGDGEIDFRAGDPLPFTPEHSFSFWTTYDFQNGLMIGYGATYQGEITFNRFNDTSPLFYAPDYWVHRAMISYELTDNAVLQLNVNNLFDEEYYTRIRNNATNGWATPGDTRNAVLQLSYRF